MDENIKTADDLLSDLYKDIIGDESVIEENTSAGESEDNEGGEDKSQLEPSNAESEGTDPVDTSESDDTGEDIFEDWDKSEPQSSDDNTEGDQVEKEVDYSDIGKVLGLENVKKDDLIKAIKSVKETADTLGKLPEDLGAAVKLALDGKEYKSVFKQEESGFDHKLYDDDTLLKHEYSSLFNDEDGNTNIQELNDYIDTLDPIQKKIEAKKIRQSLDTLAEQKRRQEEYQREQEYIRRDTELKHTLDSRDNIKGFKLTPDVKKDIYEKIASGDAVKEMFYNDKNEYDMTKVVDAYFVYKNFDRIKNFLVSKTRNEIKREDFNNISNTEVNRTASHTDAIPQKEVSGVDLMLQELMKRNGLT